MKVRDKQKSCPFSGVETTLIFSRMSFFSDQFLWYKIFTKLGQSFSDDKKASYLSIIPSCFFSFFTVTYCFLFNFRPSIIERKGAENEGI